MQKRSIPILALLVIILSMIACEGATSGSVVGSKKSCEIRGNSGVCDGHIQKLSGTYGIEIESERFRSDDTIDVEIEVFIGTGNLNASVESSGGKISSVQVLPNRPQKLIGQAGGDDGFFEVVFEAVDGDVENLLWSLSYQIK